jgi:hypothetical protein
MYTAQRVEERRNSIVYLNRHEAALITKYIKWNLYVRTSIKNNFIILKSLIRDGIDHHTYRQAGKQTDNNNYRKELKIPEIWFWGIEDNKIIKLNNKNFIELARAWSNRWESRHTYVCTLKV